MTEDKNSYVESRATTEMVAKRVIGVYEEVFEYVEHIKLVVYE